MFNAPAEPGAIQYGWKSVATLPRYMKATSIARCPNALRSYCANLMRASSPPFSNSSRDSLEGRMVSPASRGRTTAELSERRQSERPCSARNRQGTIGM
jgi:hypothetical protein